MTEPVTALTRREHHPLIDDVRALGVEQMVDIMNGSDKRIGVAALITGASSASRWR